MLKINAEDANTHNDFLASIKIKEFFLHSDQYHFIENFIVSYDMMELVKGEDGTDWVTLLIRIVENNSTEMSIDKMTHQWDQHILEMVDSETDIIYLDKNRNSGYGLSLLITVFNNEGLRLSTVPISDALMMRCDLDEVTINDNGDFINIYSITLKGEIDLNMISNEDMAFVEKEAMDYVTTINTLKAMGLPDPKIEDSKWTLIQNKNNEEDDQK